MKPACTIVDEVASRLASHAGYVWSHLAEHPGYTRNIFREQARSMMAIVDAGVLAASPTSQR